MKLKLALLLSIAASFFAFGGASAQASITCHMGPPSTPTYQSGWFAAQNGPPTAAMRVYCTGSGASIDHVQLLSQMFVGGTASYDNGFGYQDAYPADEFMYCQTAGDEHWVLDANGNSYDMTVYVNAKAHNSCGGGFHPFSFHYATATICDGLPHWYGDRWFAYVHLKDGTTTPLLQSVDSGGLYRSC